MIVWNFTRCGINSKGSKGLDFEWNYAQLKFKPGTVKENKSTIGLMAEIEALLLRFPAGGPIVDSLSSTLCVTNYTCSCQLPL